VRPANNDGQYLPSGDSGDAYQASGVAYSCSSSGSGEGEAKKSSTSSSSSSEDCPVEMDKSTLFWNDQFQELMSNLDDPMSWSKLATLGRDFIFVAEMYGR
jgi:hypothetical protein